MKLLAIFLVCLFANGINGFSERMCGEKLTQLLWIVCENGFNKLALNKRAGLPSIDSDLPYPFEPNSLANIFQFDDGSFRAKNRPIRMQGIVEDCCKKSCTFQQLSAYCSH